MLRKMYESIVMLFNATESDKNTAKIALMLMPWIRVTFHETKLIKKFVCWERALISFVWLQELDIV